MADISITPRILHPYTSGTSGSRLQPSRPSLASNNEQPEVARILTSPARLNDPTDTANDVARNFDASDMIASSSYPVSAEERDAPDPAIIDALRSAKERLWVLKLGETMESFIQDPVDSPLQLTPASSYQRMLVHRCASYYRLHPESEGQNRPITVSIVADTRMPSLRMADIVPVDNSSLPAFKIMRRSATDKLHRKGRSGSADGDSDGSDGGSSGKAKKKRNMTIAEREAAYNEARSRIFSRQEESEGLISASSSSRSISSTASSSDNTSNISAIDEDGAHSDGSLSRTISKSGTKRAIGKDRWADSTKAMADDFDPEFDRSGFSYPSIYDSPATNYDAEYAMPPSNAPQSKEHAFVPPHYAMYPPYAGYPPPYMAPYPYYYDPRQFGYGAPPPQSGEGVGTGLGHPTSAPYVMHQPGMQPWYPPPPQPSTPPGHPSHPTSQQPSRPPHPSPSPYFNPVATPFYPPQYRMPPYDVHTTAGGPPLPQSYHPLQQEYLRPTNQPASRQFSVDENHRENNGMGAQHSISLANMRVPPSRSTSSTVSNREATGTAVGRMRGGLDSQTSHTPPQLTYNPWTFGPGLGVPMFRKSSSRTGSVSSRSGSGSTGAITPADETGSIAVRLTATSLREFSTEPLRAQSSETSSSSSRKTFTSSSSRHPLPVRPDWAIIGSSSSNHSRRSSASNSSDFPPLPAGGSRTVSAPTVSAFSGHSPATSSAPEIPSGPWKTNMPNLSAKSLLKDTVGEELHRRLNGGQHHPTSGGVTLGLTNVLVSRPYSNTVKPSLVRSTSSQLPPPSASLPAPPNRAVAAAALLQQREHQNQGRMRPTSDVTFRRPPPKSAELFVPSASKIFTPNSQQASSSTSSPSHKEGLDQSAGPNVQNIAEPASDRLRGEAVANAILVDKMATLRIAALTSGVLDTRVANDEEETSESLARRGTITQLRLSGPSSPSVGAPSTA